MRKYMYALLFIGAIFSFANCTTAEIPATGQVTGTIKYDPDIKTIMQNNCLNCHGAVNPQGGLSLTNYQQVRSSGESGKLTGRMNNAASPMPPSGLLSGTTRAIVDKWVADGYVER